MRTTSSSPVNRKSYWKGKSNPSSSNFCKSEDLSFLPRKKSSRTWKRALIFLDKTCADTRTGNCSSNPPRRTSRPSWRAFEGQSKPRWIKEKYFERLRDRDWSFVGERYDHQGQPYKVRLLLAAHTRIQRHVKVKSDANPYDPAYETYFQKREADHMRDTLRGSRILRYLWYEQRGLCLACKPKITRITGWRL